MNQETLFRLNSFSLCFQVSVIQYGVDPRFMFTLNQYQTKQQVVNAAAQITQIYGSSTNTFRAIQFARLVPPVEGFVVF